MTCSLFCVLTSLLLTTFPSGATGSLTLMITGNTTENVNKHSLASLFVDYYDDYIKESPSQLFVFTNGVTLPVSTQDNGLFSGWSDIELHTNVTTLIVTNIGIDQMSLNQLNIVHRLITINSALIVIEIGSTKIETRVLLERCASCSMRGYVSIASPNVVYFCNSASPNILSQILHFEKILNIEPFEHKDSCGEPQRWLTWPNLFVSAAKPGERTHEDHKHEHSQHRHHDHLHHSHHHNSHHSHNKRSSNFEEDVEEIVDMIMENIVEQGGISATNTPPVKQSKIDMKNACKYRKSCYETNIRPVIHDSPFFNFSQWWTEKSEETIEEKGGKMKTYNASEDLPLQKCQCKYRHSCYQERGIPFQEKSESGEKKKPIRANKALVMQHGKKKTLKEIAAQTLKKLQESEEKAAKRPLIKIVEKHLTVREEKLSEKLKCKYRKSCYETGERPHVEESWSLPITIFSTESVDSENNQINFEELEQLEKKLFCKYRKSCYETGVKPDIEPEIFIDNLRDLTTIHEQVETRKLTLQEKCKYRKSCYESGVVPEINPKLEAAISKEVSSVIPTNAQDLRLLCKYRKSCYAEVHNSATVDTIKLIRKRRQIEKEVRRRKARRAKLHRRLSGGMQLGHYRTLGVKRAHNESFDDQNGGSLRASKISDFKRIRKQTQDKQEDGEIKELSDNEGKRGRLKKSKQQQVKEPAQAITVMSKGAFLTKKERKGRKTKLEKQVPEETLTVENSEKLNEKGSTNGEKTAKSTKTELDSGTLKDNAEKQQPTPDGIIDDVKKGKRLGKAVQSMNKLIEEMHHQQEQQKRKEFCKYRKSCYETGKKPEIRQSLHNLLRMFKEHVDREIVEDHVLSKTEVEKKLDCKYRRSCYGTNQYSPTYDVADAAAKKQDHSSVDTKKDDSHVIKSSKELCKPGKPCYPIAQPKADEDLEGSTERIGIERYKKSGKCSPYYYSCREVLGLPPKERAPIGPNGRRLCRKKPL